MKKLDLEVLVMLSWLFVFHLFLLGGWAGWTTAAIFAVAADWIAGTVVYLVIKDRFQIPECIPKDTAKDPPANSNLPTAA